MLFAESLTMPDALVIIAMFAFTGFICWLTTRH